MLKGCMKGPVFISSVNYSGAMDNDRGEWERDH